MKNALIIGASGGIGAAVAQELTARGVQVTGLSRSADGLDVTDETSVQDHLSRQEGPFDLIFVATGALEINGAAPEKSIKRLDPQAMMDQFRLNTIGPAMVLKHAIGLLPRKERGVMAVLSARVAFMLYILLSPNVIFHLNLIPTYFQRILVFSNDCVTKSIVRVSLKSFFQFVY